MGLYLSQEYGPKVSVIYRQKFELRLCTHYSFFLDLSIWPKSVFSLETSDCLGLILVSESASVFISGHKDFDFRRVYLPKFPSQPLEG